MNLINHKDGQIKPQHVLFVIFQQIYLVLQHISLYRSWGIMPVQLLNELSYLFFQMMVRYNRVECISHPVCTAFLRMKWLGYGVWIHMMNLLIYLAFLGSLTAFITTSDGFMHQADVKKIILY